MLRAYPDLLEAQLRALLEVSQQNRIGILIPMVTTESDVVQVAELFHRLAAEMGIRKLPRLGAMIRDAGGGFVNPFAEEARGLFQHRL